MSAIDPNNSPAPGNYFFTHYAVEVGSGGFGWVCKATRLSDGRLVAIKLILKDRMARESIVRAEWEHSEGLDVWDDGNIVLPLEAYVLRQASHRGVVEYLDLFADDNYFYLVMEHHGSPWRKAVKQEPAPIVAPPSPPLTPPTSLFPLGSSPRASSPSSPTSSTFDGAMSARSARSARPSMPRRSSALNSLSLTSLDSTIVAAPSPTKMLRSMPMMRRSSSSDLFECIEQHSFFLEPTARLLFRQIVDVVYDLRKRGITHRDLKDENIVVDASGCVKLVDFGSALHFNPKTPVPLCERFYGTATSASPEVLDKLPYHPFSAEVWSLGVLLHILLTGSAPFPTRQHIKRGQRTRDVNTRLSPEAQDLLNACFLVDVDDRITLEELRNHPWMHAYT